MGIINSWISVIKKEEPTQEELRRANVCNGCEFKKYSRYLKSIKGKVKELNGYLCNDCGCPLIAKVKNNNKCPQNKW